MAHVAIDAADRVQRRQELGPSFLIAEEALRAALRPGRPDCSTIALSWRAAAFNAIIESMYLMPSSPRSVQPAKSFDIRRRKASSGISPASAGSRICW